MGIQDGWVCLWANTGESHRSEFVLAHREQWSEPMGVVVNAWSEPMGVVVNAYDGDGYGHMDDAPDLEMFRFSLDRCTLVDGVLSDNPFHPDDEAWFASRVEDAARCCGVRADEVRQALCSDDPVSRFGGYEVLASYMGWDEFDHHPDWSKTPRDRRILRRAMRRWETQAMLVQNARRAVGADMPFAVLADWYQDKGDDKAAALIRGR